MTDKTDKTLKRRTFLGWCGGVFAALGVGAPVEADEAPAEPVTLAVDPATDGVAICKPGGAFMRDHGYSLGPDGNLYGADSAVVQMYPHDSHIHSYPLHLPTDTETTVPGLPGCRAILTYGKHTYIIEAGDGLEYIAKGEQLLHNGWGLNHGREKPDYHEDSDGNIFGPHWAVVSVYKLGPGYHQEYFLSIPTGSSVEVPSTGAVTLGGLTFAIVKGGFLAYSAETRRITNNGMVLVSSVSREVAQLPIPKPSAGRLIKPHAPPGPNAPTFNPNPWKGWDQDAANRKMKLLVRSYRTGTIKKTTT
jgi:hypothetical protein